MRRSKYLFRMFLLLTLIILSTSCFEEKLDWKYSRIELKTDKTEIDANGNDKALIGADVYEKDGDTINEMAKHEVEYFALVPISMVRSESKSKKEQRLNSNKFSSKDPGEFQIIGKILDPNKKDYVISNPLTINARVIPKVAKIIVIPDKEILNPDNEDLVKFTYKVLNQYNEEMKEIKPELYVQETQKLTIWEYKTDKAGSYNFSAKYKEVRSEDVVIETDLYLSTLKVFINEEEQNIGFTKNDKNYNLGKVDSSIEKLKIQTSSSIKNCDIKFSVNKGELNNFINPSDITLKNGSNNIDVIVTSFDETISKTYTIEIYKKSNDTALSDIILTTGKVISDMKFDNKKTLYKVDVSHLTDTVSFNISSENNITITVTTNEVETKNYEPNKKTDDYPLNNNENKFEITITAEDENFSKSFIYIVNKLLDNNNSLKSLSIMANKNEYIENFESAKNEYNITVNYDIQSVFIKAEKEKENAKIKGNIGNYDLKIGDNQIVVKVTAENGNEKNYAINIYRKSNNSYLKSLETNIGYIDFDKDTTLYDLKVGVDVSKIKIKSFKDDLKAKKIELVYSDKVEDLNDDILSNEIPLTFGINKISVIVTAEDENHKKTYTININRLESDENVLKALEIINNEKNLLTNFEKNTLVYKLNVASEIEKVNIIATADKSATISGDGEKDLEYGENIINILVTAQNGDKSKYSITIYRKTNNATLKTLEVEGFVFNFKPEIKEYNLDSVGSGVHKINIKAIPADDKAKVLVRVNNDIYKDLIDNIISAELIQGKNIFRIKVIAEDESTLEYTCSIIKFSGNINLSNINIKDIQIDFDKDKQNYTLPAVEYDKESFNLTANTEDSSSSLLLIVNSEEEKTINSGQTQNIKLNIGDNSVVIRVISEDKAHKREYSIKIKRKSNIATLSSLVTSLSEIILKKDIYKYELEDQASSVEEFAFTATAKNANSSIKMMINGSQATELKSGIQSSSVKLNKGDNVLYIVVTAEDKNYTNQYEVRIRRKKDNANLVGLSSSIGSLIFKKEVLEYDLGNVPSTSKKINIKAITEDINSKIELSENGFDYRTIKTNVEEKDLELKIGKNEFIIKVSAEDNFISKIYKIKVKRLSNIAELSDLTITGGMLEFNKEIDTYELDPVSFNTKEITVSPVAVDKNCKIEVRENTGHWKTVPSGEVSDLLPLKIGDNSIYIKIISEDDTKQKTYTIKIRRTNNSVNLSDLKVSIGVIEFKKDTINYDFGNVSYKDNKVKITAVSEDENSKMLVKSNSNEWQDIKTNVESNDISLKTGKNVIYIKVFGEDQSSSQTYTINIYRKNNDTKLTQLLLTTGNLIFDESKYEYNLDPVSSRIDEVAVIATTQDEKANIKIRFNNKIWIDVENGQSSDTLSLEKGANKIELKVFAEDETISSVYTINFRRKSDSSTLAALTTNVGKLIFDANTYEYSLGNVNNNVNQLKLLAVSDEENSIISVKVGNKEYTVIESEKESIPFDLEEGENLIFIKIVAEDTTINSIYTLKINRLSNIADIIDISLSYKDIEFNQEKITYDIGKIPYSVESLNLSAIKENPKSDLEVKVNNEGWTEIADGFMSPILNLEVGQNNIYLRITSEDGSEEKTYTIKLYRNNGQAILKMLRVDPLVFDFTGVMKNEIGDIKNSITNINVLAELKDLKSTMEYRLNSGEWTSIENNVETGELPIAVGKNTVYVRVFAEDKSIFKIYTVEMNRLNSVATLDNLDLNIGNIEFDTNTFTYEMNPVPYDTDKVIINAKFTDEESTATFQINGSLHYNLENEKETDERNIYVGDNTINVQVRASDNSIVQVYKIKVRRLNKEARLMSLIIGGITYEYDEDVFEYDLGTVLNKTSIIGLTPSATNETSSVRVSVNGGEWTPIMFATNASINLNVGENKFVIKVYGEDESFTKTYTYKITRLRNITKLIDLTASAGNLAFDPESTSYIYDLGSIPYAEDQMTISANPVDAESTMELRINTGHWLPLDRNVISSSIPLNVGDNYIYVKVFAQDITNDRMYTLKIRRQNNNSGLTWVVVPGMKIDFKANVFNYELAPVEPGKEYFNITPTLFNNVGSIMEIKFNDSEFKEIRSGGLSENLYYKLGDNIAIIKVYAEDRSITSLYSFKIRQLNDVTDLKDLILSTGNFTFNKELSAYTLPDLNSKIESIRFTPVIEDVNGKIEYRINAGLWQGIESNIISDQIPLIIGDNIIEIKCIAEYDFSRKIYTINARRQNNLAELYGLSPSGGGITFKKDIYEYDLGDRSNSSETFYVTAKADPDHKSNLFVRVNNSEWSKLPNNSVSDPLILSVGQNIIDVKVVAEDVNISNIYKIKLNRQSNNSNVTEITVSAGNFVFNPNTTTYDLGSVGNSTDNITVMANTENSKAVIEARVNAGHWQTIKPGELSNDLPLIIGDNTISVTVKSEDESMSKLYTMNIKRSSNDVRLSALNVSEGSIVFESTTLSYNLGNIPFNTENLTIVPNSESIGSTIKYRNNNSEWFDISSGATSELINLNVGLNIISIKVVAEDLSISQTYTLSITKMSGNVNLSNLEITNGEMTFNKDIINYNLGDVKYSVDSIKLTPYSDDNKSTIEYKINDNLFTEIDSGYSTNDLALNIGENIIQVRVNSEDKSLNKTYTLTINRQSGNTNLKDITVSNVVFEFSQETTSYDLGNLTSNISSVNITAIPEYEKATLKIKVGSGEWNSLTPGQKTEEITIQDGINNIYILVAAEDSEFTKMYSLSLTKLNGNANLIAISFSNGTLSDFSKDKYTYDLGKVNYNEDSLVLSPSSSNENISKIEVRINSGLWKEVKNETPSSTLNLNVGNNVIEVKLYAEDENITSIYTFNIYRKNNNSNLIDLKVNAGNMIFEKTTSQYDLGKVGYDVSNITINPSAEDENYTSIKTRVNGGNWQEVVSGVSSENLPLAIGENSIDIYVYSEDPTKISIYTINVYRKENVSNLTNISTNLGTLVFNEETLNYDLGRVIYNENELKLIPVSASEKISSIEININNTSWNEIVSGSTTNPIKLLIGENNIKIRIKAEDSIYTTTYELKIYRESNISGLNNISISKGILNFSEDISEYNLDYYGFDTTEIGITAIPISEYSSVKARINNGNWQNIGKEDFTNFALNIKENIIEVEVSAEDKSFKKSYKLNIYRKNNDSLLEYLFVNAGSLGTFTSETLTYDLGMVGNSINHFNVTATSKDTDVSKIEVNANNTNWVLLENDSASSDLNINVGNNVYNIRVTAEDKSFSKTYTLNIYRKSSNNLLSNLVVSKGDLTFNQETFEYDLGVLNYDDDSLIITTYASDEKYTQIRVNVNNNTWEKLISETPSTSLPLKTGSNIIEINVVAEDNTFMKSYTLNVYRKNNNANLFSLNNNIKSIIFDPDVTDYDLGEVTFNTDSIVVTPTLEDYKASKIEIKINVDAWIEVKNDTASPSLNLQVGKNTIEVKVNAEDQLYTKSYKLILYRKDNNTNLINLATSIGNLEFVSDNSSYDMGNVPFETESVSVTAYSPENISKIETRINLGEWQTIESGVTSNPLIFKTGYNKVEVRVFSEDLIYSRTYTISYYKQNNDPTLSNLISSIGTLVFDGSEMFDLGKVNYDSDQIKITPIANDNNVSKIEINSNNNDWVTVENGLISDPLTLLTGENTVNIRVIAEDSSFEKLYIIKIYRMDNNIKLSNITTSVGNITFEGNTTSYNLGSVSYDTTSIKVTPYSATENYSEIKARINNSEWENVVSGDSTSELLINVGLNLIEIQIIAEDKIFKSTYTLEIYKKAINSNLSSLSTSLGEFAFDGSTSYDLGKVSYNVNEIKITAIAEDVNFSKIEFNNNNSYWLEVENDTLSDPLSLREGENNLQVRIKAEDSNYQTIYKLKIIRKNNESLLNNITTSKGTLLFEENQFDYDLGVVGYNNTSINFIATVKDLNYSSLKIRVNNESWQNILTDINSKELNLKIGANIIDIYSYAEDEIFYSKYKFNIYRKNNNANLTNLSSSAGIMTFDGSLSYDLGEISSNISAVTLNVTAEDEKITSIEVNANSGNWVTVENDSTSNPFDIVDGNNTILVRVRAEDVNFEKIYTLKIYRKNSNIKLSNLDVSIGTIVFNSNTLNYDLGSVSYDTTAIQVTPYSETESYSDIRARINNSEWESIVSGISSTELPLTVGNNTVEVQIIAEDITFKSTYKLSIYKQQNIADLKSLTTTIGSLLFNGNTEYNLGEFDYTTDKINITAEFSDENSTSIEVNNNNTIWEKIENGIISNDLPIKVGNNIFKVRVKAEDPNYEKIYSITLYRKNNTSTLENLNVSVGDLLFDGSTEYNLGITNYSNETINISPIVSDKNYSEIKVRLNNSDWKVINSGQISENYNLSVGSNLIEIAVYAEDNSYFTNYKLRLYRKNNNMNLYSLSCNIGSIIFDNSDIYDLGKIKFDVSKMNIYLQAEDSNITKIEINPNNSSWIEIEDNKTTKDFDIKTGDNIFDIRVFAEDSTFTKNYKIKVYRKNNNSNLSNIIISTGDINFTSETKSYDLGKVAFDTTYITVSPFADSEKYSSIKTRINGSEYVDVINGNISENLNLKLGKNSIELLVSAEDSFFVSNYTLNIYRKNNNPELFDITTNVGNIEFNEDTTNYNIGSISFNSDSCFVTPSPEDSNVSKMEINVNSGSWDIIESGKGSNTLPLNVGDNIIQLKIYAEDESYTKSYSISLKRKNNNSSLNSLMVSDGDILFDKDKIEYDLGKIKYEISKLTITPTADDFNYNGIKYRANGNTWNAINSSDISEDIPLKIGYNKVDIKVYAEDETFIKIYNLNLYRKNNNAKLLDLSSNYGSVEFNPDLKTYDLGTFDYASEIISFYPSSFDLNASKIEVNGNNSSWIEVDNNSVSEVLPVTVGTNVFDIKVTAEDIMYKDTYRINAYRKENNCDLSGLSVSEGTIVFEKATYDYDLGKINYDKDYFNFVPVADSDKYSLISYTYDDVTWTNILSNSTSDNIPLKVGYNNIKIKVVSEDDKISKFYKLKIYRKTNNCDLSQLLVSYFELSNFDKNVINYTLGEIDHDKVNVKVTPTAADQNITKIEAKSSGDWITVSDGTISDLLPIEIGENNITVRVFAEDSTYVKNYYLSVNRKNNNSLLKYLEVSTGNIIFDSNTYTYDLGTTAFTTNEFYITPTLDDVNATDIYVKINNSTYSKLSSGTTSEALPLELGENIIKVKSYAEDNKYISSYSLKIYRENNEKTLSQLILSKGTITFSPETTTYNAGNVEYIDSTLKIIPTSKDVNSNISYNINSGSFIPVNSGNSTEDINLQVGENIIIVKVEAEDSNYIENYIVNITRLNNNTKLSNLIISSGSLTFDKDINEYDLGSVQYSVGAVTITPYLEDGNAKKIEVDINSSGFTEISDSSTSHDLILNYGSNRIKVMVTAQDDNYSNTYIFNVQRLSNNSKLSTLTVSSGVLSNFDSATYSYDLGTVGSNNDTISITPTGIHENTKIEIRINGGHYEAVTSGNKSNPFDLIIGDNIIEIKTTSEDSSSTQTYTINIRRTNDNVNLSMLQISEGSLIFDTSTTDYDLGTINFDKEFLTITPTTEDNNSTIKYQVNNGLLVDIVSGAISENINLGIGSNTINIRVIAENGLTTQNYQLIIYRKSDNSNLSELTTSFDMISFDPEQTEYTLSDVSYDISSIKVTPTAQSELYSKIELKINDGLWGNISSGSNSGELNLNVGNNIISIRVTAEDETYNETYTVSVKRKTNDSTLSNITVNKGSLTFNGDLEYNIGTLTSDDDDIKITLSKNDINANIKLKINNKDLIDYVEETTLNLSYGTNIINIFVTAEDVNYTTNYKITCYRAAGDLSLESLEYSLGSYDFGGFGDYNLDAVGYDSSIMTITATLPTESLSTLKVRLNTGEWMDLTSGTPSENLNLNVGENSVELKVIGEDVSKNGTYKLHIRRKSNICTLEDVLIDGIVIYFEKDKERWQYSVNHNFDTTKFKAIKTEGVSKLEYNFEDSGWAEISNDTYSKTIPLELNGYNILQIKAYAEDTTYSKIYQFDVYRLNGDVKLTGLNIFPGTINFDKDNLQETYDAGEVATNKTSVKVTPSVASDNRATIQVSINGNHYEEVYSGSASKDLPILVGDNTINIKVISEDNTEFKDYKIKIYRKNNKTSLTDLDVLNYNIGFNGNHSYSIYDVASNIDSVEVKAVLEDKNATMEVKVNNSGWTSLNDDTNSIPLSIIAGSNIITVKVHGEDITYSRSYTIYITKLNNDANLTNIMVSKGSLAFDGSESYNLGKVSNDTTAMTIQPFISDSKATMIYNVNDSVWNEIESGAVSETIPLETIGDNVILIKVTAEDTNVAKTYTLTIRRMSNDNNYESVELLSGIDETLTYKNTHDIDPIDSKTNYLQMIVNTVSQYSEIKVKTNDNGWIVLQSGIENPVNSLPLNLFENKVTIEVTAEDGSRYRNVYINIRKKATGGIITNWEEGVFTYNLPEKGFYEYIFESGSILFSAYSTGVYRKNGGSWIELKPHSSLSGYKYIDDQLLHGDNVFEIRVSSEDGYTENTYTLNVPRSEEQLTIEFVDYVGRYTYNSSNYVLRSDGFKYSDSVKVPNAIETLEINPELKDSRVYYSIKANGIELGEFNSDDTFEVELLEGNNYIEYTIKSSNGLHSSIYTSVIIRDTHDTYIRFMKYAFKHVAASNDYTTIYKILGDTNIDLGTTNMANEEFKLVTYTVLSDLAQGTEKYIVQHTEKYNVTKDYTWESWSTNDYETMLAEGDNYFFIKLVNGDITKIYELKITRE